MPPSAFLSRWTQSISRFGRDGMTLSKAIYLETSKTTATSTTRTRTSTAEIFKSVLLDQARHPINPNTVAASYLRIEKVYGLMKYMGFNEYMKQKFIPLLSSSSSSLSSSTSSSSTSSLSSSTSSSSSSPSSLADRNNNINNDTNTDSDTIIIRIQQKLHS